MHEDELHSRLKNFLDTARYEVKTIVGPCNKNHDEVMEHYKSQGFEVFPEVLTTDHKDCRILIRRKKPN